MMRRVGIVAVVLLALVACCMIGWGAGWPRQTRHSASGATPWPVSWPNAATMPTNAAMPYRHVLSPAGRGARSGSGSE